MGNRFEKTSNRRKDERKKAKLNDLFEEKVNKLSIDYSNQELQDIQTSVRTMLEKVVTRVNARGVFKISRIHPCGSMAEQTSTWKHHSWNAEVYTEFDFLAVLEDSRRTFDINLKLADCASCFGVTRDTPTEHQSKSREDFRMEIDRSFWKEVNWCSVLSSCEGFSVNFDKNPDSARQQLTSTSHEDIKSFKPHRCAKCTIETPTGYFRINSTIALERGLLNTAWICRLLFVVLVDQQE